MKKKVYLPLGFALSIFLAYTLYSFSSMPIKAVEFRSVAAVDGLLFKKVKTQLESLSQEYVGQNLIKLNLRMLANRFEEYKEIKEARVFRRFSGRVNVDLLFHKPSAVYLSKRNKLYPVSVTGVLLSEIAVKEFPDLPIIRGELFMTDKKARLRAVKILEFLPQAGRFSKENISEIYKSKTNGYTLVLKSTGTEVFLGESFINKKLLSVAKVLKYMDDGRLEGRVIDARFLKKVVVKVY